MNWNPSQYLEYEDARLRPALDLLARIDLDAPESVVDLGCGAGNVARWLARRWPAARIEGVDGDPAMLARARTTTADAARHTWRQCQLDEWRPAGPADVVYSNAALHWLDHHESLFPRLFGHVAPGGVLAVQMPDNFAAPSHTALFAVANDLRWRDRLLGHLRPAPVASVIQYYEWLAPYARTIDLWTTEYLQRLPARADGEHPVVAWMRGTALVPFLGALAHAEREAFVAALAVRIDSAYPLRDDGGVLFPFRRIFIVAKRSGHLSD